MAKDAEYDDTCEYCGTPILVDLGHKVATSPYLGKRKPNNTEYWIHEECRVELKELEKNKIADISAQEALKLALMEKLVRPSSQPVPLEEYDDEPGPYDEPRYVRIEEAASRADMSVSTMRKVIREGYARSYKKGNVTYVELPAKAAL